MARDLRRELDEHATWPPAWKPQPGDTLIGTVQRYDEGLTPYGPAYVATIREEAKLVAVWLTSTVLFDLFRRYRPRPGERIGIKYLGKTDSPKLYHRYHLIVDRPPELPDFGPLPETRSLPPPPADVVVDVEAET